MNRKFFISCHRIVTCSSYSRPLFTSNLFGLSRVDRLRVNTAFQGTVDLVVWPTSNQHINQIIKYTSTNQDKLIKVRKNPYKKDDKKEETLPEESSTFSSEASIPEEKQTLFKRFKSMYRDYWYVLIPVHVITSLGWFTAFYYVAESGIDLAALAESIHLSESLTDKLRSGGSTITGYLAIAYALYKIATPLRYTVTLGGTTITINYLRKWGYIKPIPKREDLKKMYNDKKQSLKGAREEMKAYMADKLSKKNGS